MKPPRVSVIIPTVAGREEHFRRCVTAYDKLTRGACGLELIIERDHPTCGMAWQHGAERATGDYLHFTADDIEPAGDWAAPAIEALNQGFQPAPMVRDPSGTPQSPPQWGTEHPDWTPAHMSVLPFVTRELYREHIRPLFTAHYYTDDFISWRAERAGYPVRVRTGYAFTHHWAQHKRGAGMTEAARMQYDHALYIRAQAMVATGEWITPWPEMP